MGNDGNMEFDEILEEFKGVAKDIEKLYKKTEKRIKKIEKNYTNGYMITPHLKYITMKLYTGNGDSLYGIITGLIKGMEGPDDKKKKR